MFARRVLLAALSFLAAVGPVAAERLQTLKGETIEGELRGLYGDVLIVRTKQGSATLDLRSLDDASLLTVAGFLARPAPPRTEWATSTSKVAKSLAKKLQVLRDDKLFPFDPGTRLEPEFYLVYFGALWCGPCRRFSPDLVATYQRLQAVAPDRFEVIFVSDDHDDRKQLEYAREVQMPWPVLRYSARNVPVFDQWRGNGIPCLVVLTRDGDLIFNSYRGTEYLGAHDPLEKISRLLTETQPTAKPRPNPPARHRLAIAQHLQAAAGETRAAKPYFVAIDRRRLRTLTVPSVTAHLTIDAKGHVTDVEFSPQLDLVSKEQLRRDSADWLFLPALTNGQPQEARVDLPIRFDPS